MRISSFAVDNFRSINSLVMMNLPNLNVIVGANSSGKSNILEALDVFLRGISPVIDDQDTSAPDYIWPRQNPVSEIKFTAVIEFDKDEFRISPVLAEGNAAFQRKTYRVEITKYLIKTPRRHWKTYAISINGLILHSEGSPVPGNLVENTTYPSAAQEILTQLAQLIAAKYKYMGFDRLVNPAYKTPGQRVPAISQETIQSIIQLETASEPERDDMAYKLIQQFGEMSEDQELLVDESTIRVREGSARIELRSIGAGMQTMLALIHDLLHVDGILAIEEPETHLHADLQRRVFDRLKEMSGQSQIFLTTHSTIFLDECDNGQVWHVKKRDGATSVKRTEGFDDLREVALGLGVKRSDVLLANSILLVEGWTEKIVIPAWGLLLGKRFLPPKVSIIQMGGAGKGRYHLSLWNQLAKEIDVPRFMLLDGDDIAKKAAKSIITEKTIPKDSICNLKRTSIEDYYPKRFVVGGLSEILSLNTDMKRSLTESIHQTNRVKAIQKFMMDVDIDYTRNWKIDLAEYVVARMGARDLNREIKDIMLRIDNSLISSTNES